MKKELIQLIENQIEINVYCMNKVITHPDTFPVSCDKVSIGCEKQIEKLERMKEYLLKMEDS